MLLVSLLISLAVALPAASGPARRAATGIFTLSAQEIAAFKPFSFFAAAAYCPPARTSTWSCGSLCSANADFLPIASGGNGATVQFWYVGYSPSLRSVVVGHQGTDPTKLAAVSTDLEAFLSPLSQTLFPGLNSAILVHEGFSEEHALVAPDVLSAVKGGLSRNRATRVTVVGHSLGGALALLNAVYLPLNLPASIVFKSVVYGMPRVGNQAFVDYVDAHVHDFTRISNKRDPISVIPDKLFGYHHPSGEIHIDALNAWNRCPGQDNPDPSCIAGTVQNIFEGNLFDHTGPYDGITMGQCV